MKNWIAIPIMLLLVAGGLYFADREYVNGWHSGNNSGYNYGYLKGNISGFYDGEAFGIQKQYIYSLTQQALWEQAIEGNRTELEKKVYSYNKYVKENFEYVLQPYDDESRPISEIISEGGDCSDWTRVYESLAKKDKLQTQRIYTLNHVMLRIYKDNTGYCDVDQTDIHCGRLG
jgi:hypothetical protein